MEEREGGSGAGKEEVLGAGKAEDLEAGKGVGLKGKRKEEE